MGSQPQPLTAAFVSPQCNVGWAGNGNVCGPDTDIDGYPDQALPCMDNNKHCKQVQAAGGHEGGGQGGRPSHTPRRSPSSPQPTFRTTAF